MALLDARALLDPLVGSIDLFGQFRVGDDALGQARADAAHYGTKV